MRILKETKYIMIYYIYISGINYIYYVGYVNCYYITATHKKLVYASGKFSTILKFWF
jgi:hypothetical protein